MSSKAIAIRHRSPAAVWEKNFTRLLAHEPGLEEIWAVARHRETLKHLEREFGSSIRPFAADLSRQEERLNFLRCFKMNSLICAILSTVRDTLNFVPTRI